MRRFFYNNFKKSLAEVSFCFHLQLHKTIHARLLSYGVTFVRKYKKQCHNKLNKDFQLKKVSEEAYSKLMIKN